MSELPHQGNYIKPIGVIGLPMHDILLVFNSSMWFNSAFLLYKIFQIWVTLTYLLMSLRVKCNDVARISYIIYDFRLVPKKNIWPDSALWRDKGLRNLNGIEFYLSRSLKIKCNRPLYHFILVTNIKHMCIFLFYFIKAHTRTHIYKGDAGLVKTICTSPTNKINHS